MSNQKNRLATKPIAQSNEIIFGRYNYTKFESAVSMLTLAQIQKEDEDFKKYRVYISDIKAISDMKNVSHLYSQKKIKPMLRKFKEKAVEINTVVDGKKKVEFVGFIDSISYVEGDGYFEVEINRKMKPYYLHLKETGNFTLTIAGILIMKNAYSKRVYEWIKSALWKDKKDFLLSVDEIRWMLKIEDKYKVYKDFKKRILEQAKQDTQKYMDATFDYEEIKVGKVVTDILFKPKKNPKGEVLQLAKEAIFLNPLFSRLMTYGLNEEESSKILLDYDETYIKENLDEVERREKNPDIKIKSKRAYVLGSLKDDYAASHRAEQQKKSEKNTLKAIEAEAKAKDADAAKKIKEQRIVYNKLISEKLKSLEVDFLAELELFKSDPNNSGLVTMYKSIDDSKFLDDTHSSHKHLCSYIAPKYLDEELHTFDAWHTN